MGFYFHGVAVDGSSRVRVLVRDLDKFVQVGAFQHDGHRILEPVVVDYDRREDGRWVPSGNIELSKLRFDHCNTVRDEGQS